MANILNNLHFLCITTTLIRFDYIINKMNSEDHKKFLESIRQSQQRSQKVLQRLDQTLCGVRETISGIQDTNKKFDKMKQEYQKVIQKLALKFSNSYRHPLKKQGQNDERPIPSVISMQKAVEAMMNHEQILFITGAGVSLGSGIPTFRGQDGLYSKKFNFNGQQMDPQKFISKQFFDKHPEPIWEWIQSLNENIKVSKPNKVHNLIDECLVQLSKKGKRAILVTQNIDDLHIKPIHNEYEYHAIHGVANKIRCSNLHMQNFDIAKVNHKCDICQQIVRPHVMFFDESYGAAFGKDVKDRAFDFVVVIGSSLSTGLCIRLASQAKQIIQINPSPVIEVGNVHPFPQQTSQVLAEMLKFIKLHQS